MRAGIAKAAIGGVLIAAVVPAAPAAAANESDMCSSPTAQVADGFAGTSYVKLRVQEADPNHTWVCYRVNGPGTGNSGGRIVVTKPSTSPAQPTVDGNVDACTGDGGEAIASGHLFDESEETYTPYLLDADSATGAASACLMVGDFKRRVAISAPGVVAPDVDVYTDSPAVPNPSPENPPAGYPSGTCQAGVGGSHDRVLNMELAGGSHVWLEAWRASTGHAALCVRVEGGLVSAGGALAYDATGSPGVTPVLSTGSSMDPCTRDIFANQQQDLLVARSAGSNPASLCVKRGSSVTSVTVGTTGSPSVALPSWTSDPGTPLPSFP